MTIPPPNAHPTRPVKTSHVGPGVKGPMVSLRYWAYLMVALLPVSYGANNQVRAFWSLALAMTLLVSLLLQRTREPRHSVIWVIASVLAALAALTTAANAPFDQRSHWSTAFGLVLLWGVSPFVVGRLTYSPLVMRGLFRSFVVGQTLSASVAVIAAC